MTFVCTAFSRLLCRPVLIAIALAICGGGCLSVGYGQALFSINPNSKQSRGRTGNSPQRTLACQEISISHGISTRRNVSVTAPIMVDDLTGRAIISYDFNVTYDPSILSAPVVSNAGTLSSGMEITVNPNTPGLLKISGFQANHLTGAGVLLNIAFTAIGPIGSGSDVSFSTFAFNEGDPCTDTIDGHIDIISGTIAGAITYPNAQTPPVAVPHVLLSAMGSSNRATTTDLSGLYLFGGFGPGPYTVTPSKSDDVNGITGFDSALIAQHIVELITLNATQLLAADVSQNGEVTSFDAALIAQYVVLIPNVGNTGTWIFTPANRSYANVEPDFVGQDYGAILMGEVSGNWEPPTMFARPAQQDAQILAVSAPTINTISGANFSIPVTVGDTTGLNILSYQFDLVYDPAVVAPQANPITTAGTISEGMLPTFNPISPGLLKVVLFTTTPRVGTGTLFKLNFTALGPTGSVSPLSWVNFKWDEGTPGTAANNGAVRIQSPTAAAASVSGRVLTAYGQGVPNARITLTGINGGRNSVISNGFGFYEFTGVATGETYTITVEAKRFTFSPRVLTVGNDLSNFDLIAEP
jgi:hypothetical protein